MKKIFIVVLTFLVSFAFVGCSKKNKAGKTNSTTTTTKTGGGTAVDGGSTLAAVDFKNNLINDGGFDVGTFNYGLNGVWVSYSEAGGKGSFTTNTKQLAITVEQTNVPNCEDFLKKMHAYQIYFDEGFSLYKNATYSFQFDVQCDLDREIEWRLQLNGGTYTPYASDIIAIGEEWTRIEHTFKMEYATDIAPRIVFNLGVINGDSDLPVHHINIDNVKLVCDDDTGIELPQRIEIPNISVNQIGYNLNDEKIAIIAGETLADVNVTFDVVKIGESGNDVIIDNRETNYFKENKSSGDWTARVNFSEITEPGTYKIVTETAGESYEFIIGSHVYNDAFGALFNMYYYQRCGCAIEDGLYAHDVCHNTNARIYGTETYIDVSGGWHDAGDYGRYVVAGAKAVADLLLSYEEMDVIGTGFSLVEAERDNGLSDILDEVKWELDWMFKMQDVDGGVYHKVTCADFCELTDKPHEETEELIVCPKSNTATGSFAAVMAMASRIFGNIEGYETYAEQCLTASKAALAYLNQEGQLDEPGVTINPTGISTGVYDDIQCLDEYFWALTELYKTTQDEQYEEEIIENVRISGLGNSSALGWQTVDLYGCFAYLTAGEVEYDEALYTKIYNRFYKAVDLAAANVVSDSYKSSLGEGPYPWGSNMSIANNGMLFLMAEIVDPESAYEYYDRKDIVVEYSTLARWQINYLFGNNATGYCFVTGFGTLSPDSTHHRPSICVDETLEGMLVGGPDNALEDPFVRRYFTTEEAENSPAKCYVDNSQSFSSNEITIYWNSPFIFLLAYYL